MSGFGLSYSPKGTSADAKGCLCMSTCQFELVACAYVCVCVYVYNLRASYVRLCARVYVCIQARREPGRGPGAVTDPEGELSHGPHLVWL